MVDENVDSVVWPRVSIVVPVYNQVLYLDETFRSIIDQGYPNLELIVMDGGSTDGSVEIIERYQSTIAYWESLPDQGQTHAISKGLARSTGDLFNWLNGDDMLVEGCLFSLASQWINAGKPAMIYGRADKVDGDGRCIKRGVFRPFDGGLLNDLYYITQPSCFYSRDVVVQAGGINIEYDYAMDWDLALRVSKKGEVHSVDALWSRLRIHAATKTSKGGICRAREIARIGFRYRGFRSKNFWIFHSLNAFERMGAGKGWAIPSLIRRKVNVLLLMIWGPNGHMVHLKDFEQV